MLDNLPCRQSRLRDCKIGILLLQKSYIHRPQSLRQKSRFLPPPFTQGRLSRDSDYRNTPNIYYKAVKLYEINTLENFLSTNCNILLIF